VRGRIRRRRPILKVAEFAKCRWYVGRGLPTSYIAERLGVSPVTVRSWRRMMRHDHVFAELRRRVLLLPKWQRDQLITTLVDARHA
jgi:transposase-like protein